MALLTAAGVHISQPLTNLTVAWLQDANNFIADKVFPRVSVQKKTNTYYIYDRAQFNRVGDVQPRAARTEAPVIGMSLSTDTYSTNLYSLAMDFDLETELNADAGLEIEAAGAQVLTSQLLIDRERKWTAKYFAAGVWTGADWTGISSAPGANQVRQWSDYTNSTPLQDVTAITQTIQLKNGGFRPNVMVMSRPVRDILINHPTILARINGGAVVNNPALVSNALLAALFGFEEVLVMDTIYNTSPEGVAESNSFIAGKGVGFYYRPRSAGLMIPSAGYIFTWDSLNITMNDGYGIDIRTYEGDYLTIQGIQKKLEANLCYDQKVVSTDMAGFITTVIA
jgi:hypothetical protein